MYEKEASTTIIISDSNRPSSVRSPTCVSVCEWERLSLSLFTVTTYYCQRRRCRRLMDYFRSVILIDIPSDVILILFSIFDFLAFFSSNRRYQIWTLVSCQVFADSGWSNGTCTTSRQTDTVIICFILRKLLTYNFLRKIYNYKLLINHKLFCQVPGDW